MVWTYRLTSDIMTKYFNDFYNQVMEGPVWRDKNLSQYFVFDKVDIPGLAKWRPKPIPSTLTVELPSCTKCMNFDKMKEILRKAHYEIMQIERRVDEALCVGVEAADRSIGRVAAYDILGALGGDSTGGIPFIDGEQLPKWFTKAHPPHSDDDPDHSENGMTCTVPDSASSGTSIPEDFVPEEDDDEKEDDSSSEDSDGSEFSEGNVSGPLGKEVEND